MSIADRFKDSVGTLFGITLPLPPRPLRVGVNGRRHYP